MHARGKAIAAVGLTLLVLLWPDVYNLSSVAITYLWWLNPTLQLALPTAVSPSEQQELPVPAIIHQTWKTKEVPDKWQQAQQSCIDLHPEYEYRLWTDEDGLQLIEDHYPWFLPTYLSYPHAIQRADAVRYFILHRHGGIYIDLDMGCLKPLHFLRRADFTAPLTNPVGLANDVMGGAPGGDYITLLIGQLRRWNRWMVIKYVQVMFSTGPMFLTVQYALAPRRVRAGVAAIPKAVYGRYDASGDAALYHLRGNSWMAADAAVVFWLDKHRGRLALLAAVAVVAAAVAWGVRRCRAVKSKSELATAFLIHSQ